QATRTAKVRLEFPNPNDNLHAGQLVTARIVADPKLSTEEVVAVPRSAIEQVEGKTVVFVKAGEAFERRNVLVGTSGGDRVEIRKGLAPGELVAGGRARPRPRRARRGGRGAGERSRWGGAGACCGSVV